jgi:hypothetical protein
MTDSFDQRELRPDLILSTLEQLQARIAARFPESGLERVCLTLVDTARWSIVDASELARPNWLLRGGVAAVVVAGLLALVWLLRLLNFGRLSTLDPPSLVQGLEAVVNLLILFGGAALFLLTIEERMKRRRALDAFYRLRSLAHIVDMHQLTKDPTIVLQGAHPTAASPRRSMTQFELTRYLDYCAEMLALIGKLAALYAERMRDGVVIDAVNDIENLTSGLGRKIWQKITIISALQDKIDTQARPLGEGPR